MKKLLCLFLPIALVCKPTPREDGAASGPFKRPSPSARQAAGQPIADSCLAQKEWTLGPLTLNSPTQQALHKLGAPVQIARDSSEDDGGTYQLTTYRYNGFEFDDVRGDVDRVVTSSPSLSTPWGIKPGLARDSISSLLARYGVRFATSADTLDIGDCGVPSAYLTIAFTKNGIAESVQIAAERP